MLSVIVPAYNEEKRITKTLDALSAFLESSFAADEYEILVVDDGSADRTADTVNAHSAKNLSLLSYGENRGKGAAVKYGVLNAKGDIIIFTDADLPYPPENIKKAVELFEKEPYDLILGNRDITEVGQKYPWYRTLMSHGFAFVVDIILNLHVPDTQCGFKCFRRDAAKKIFSKTTLAGWGFDVEIIFIAKKLGFSIGRIPVKLYHENKGSKIRIIHDAINMIKEVKIVKQNNKKGLYE